MPDGPLSGIRVVDLTSVVVGPLATQILADHGAEVIKIETKSGDLSRVMSGRSVTPKMGPKFLHLNRNKKSLVLDLKTQEGLNVLLRLLAKADVFVWNVRPASMERLNLGYERLRAINPRLIYCGMFGMGQDGRYRHKPAYDTIIQGSGGFAALHHRSDGEPRYVPMVIADKLVGLIAVQMIAMALYQRSQTGQGCSVEIPMFENVVKFVLEDHLYLKTFEPPLGPSGDPRLLDPHSKPIATKDGWICISPNTDKQAFAFFDAIGRPALKHDPRFTSVAARFANVAEYFQLRADALKERTTSEWLEVFDRFDVPAMPYHTLDSLLADPHLGDVGLIEVKEHPTEGPVRAIRSPNKWSSRMRSDWMPAPKLGQHSRELLVELGYSDAEIASMLDAGITMDASSATG